MTIGEKIRQLRKEKGLTQDAVASALEISRQAIAKWESDQSSPSTENLVKLSNLFNVSLEELVDVKQYQTAALEEYVRRRLEEDQKKAEYKTSDIPEDTGNPRHHHSLYRGVRNLRDRLSSE